MLDPSFFYDDLIVLNDNEAYVDMSKVTKAVIPCLSFDFETYKITPEDQFPKPVCLTYWDTEEQKLWLVTGMDQMRDHMHKIHEKAVRLKQPLAGANVNFDMMVAEVHLGMSGERTLRSWYRDMVEAGLVSDILEREKLYHTATGLIVEGKVPLHHVTQLPKRWNQIKRGFPSLGNLEKAYIPGVDRTAQKKAADSVRLMYHIVDGVRIPGWEREFVQYAMYDSFTTALIWGRQLYLPDPEAGPYLDPKYTGLLAYERETLNRARNFAVSTHTGMCVDHKHLSKVVQGAKIVTRYKYAYGLSKGYVRTDRKKDSGYTEQQTYIKKVLLNYFDGAVPGWALTKKGNVSAGAGVVERVHLEDLQTYTKLKKADKILSTYAKPLLLVKHRLHPGFNPLVGTSRTSSRGPNMQNWPSRDIVKNGLDIVTSLTGMPRVDEPYLGIRETLTAAPGNALVSIDWKAAELVTLAQIQLDMYGHSALAEAINAGKDVHVVVGATMAGTTYAKMMAWKKGTPEERKKFKTFRQVAKVVNFGFPGGLGPKGLILQAFTGIGPFLELATPEEKAWLERNGADKYGNQLKIATGVARRLKAFWIESFPEMETYLSDAGAECSRSNDFKTIKFIDEDGEEQIKTQRVVPYRFASGFARGRLSFTQRCNTPFQGLAAHAFSYALALADNAYLDGELPATIWNGIHDEIIFEGPREGMHEWATKASELMVKAMKKYTPDVEVEAEPAASYRWFKAADTVYDKEGKLECWAPNPSWELYDAAGNKRKP